MRWRTEGINWEGRRWRTVPSLNVLLAEHDAEYPKGNSSLDGTVASKGHDKANPASDHRPTPYTGQGVVRAYDWSFPNLDTGETIFDALRATQDRRIAYIIFNRQIVSSTNQPWKVRPYTGPNPHDRHGHLSVRAEFDGDDTPWNVWTTLPDMCTQEFVEGLEPKNIDQLIDAGIIGPDNQATRDYWKGLLADPANPEWYRFYTEMQVQSALRSGVSVADVRGVIASTRLDPS